MKTDDRVKSLESELKLMKQEVKQTLVDVHNFLTGIDLPPSPEELFDDMGGGNEPGAKAASMEVAKTSSEPASRKETDVRDRKDGNVKENNSKDGKTELNKSSISGSPVGAIAVGEAVKPDEKQKAGGKEIPVAKIEKEPEKADSPGNTKTDKKEKQRNVLPVNMLANLMRWVSEARKKIGAEQLETLLDLYYFTGYLCPELKRAILHLSQTIAPPSAREEGGLLNLMAKDQMSRFLNVYCSNGKLSPELKDSILHLIDITAERQVETDKADMWSKLMLELHGILSEDDAPISSLKLSWPGEEKEEEKPVEEVTEEAPSEKCVRLRLALPVEGGAEKEFSINLFPDAVEQVTVRTSPGGKKS